jgi:hypothetical protein
MSRGKAEIESDIPATVMRNLSKGQTSIPL